MKIQAKDKNNLRYILLLAVLLLAPILLAFDSLIYFITRPACLNCGDLIGYIRNGSLTLSLLTSTGILSFKLKK